MTKGIWVNEKTFIEFGESAANHALSEDIASRQTAWDYSGLIGLLPDPDPVLARRGDSAEILDSLTADAHLCSVIQTRKVGTLKREIKWEAGCEQGAEPTTAAKKLCDALVEDYKNIDLYNLVAQILDAPLYGYMPFELSWQPGRGRIRLVKITSKPHRWFGFDEETNNPKFISQAAPWDGEELPWGKFVIARHFPSYDNPYGLRLLSRCFWPVTFKRGGLKFWVTFAEKFGIPFMLGRYPKGTGTSEQADMLSKLVAMVQSAVAVLPEGSTVEKLGGGSDSKGSSDLFDRLISVMDKEISKVIVGQTLTAETSDKGGAYAQSKTHENVLADYQDSDQQLVKSVLNRIAKLYAEINSPGTEPPQMKWFEEEEPKKDFADRDKTLSATGLKFTRSYYRRQYNLADDDFDLQAGADSVGAGCKGGVQTRPYGTHHNGTNPNGTSPYKPAPTPQAFAEADAAFTPEQQAVETLADDGIARAQRALAANEEAILKTVQNSSSYEEAMDKLLALYPSLSVEGVKTALEEALFAGMAFGVSQVRLPGASGDRNQKTEERG